MALRADDDFLEHEEGSEIDPVEPRCVWRIVEIDEHPYLLFIAPALVLGAQQSICEVEVHVIRTTDLQEIRLIKDIGVVVGAGIALSDVEAETHAGMRSAVVTPEQQIVPVPAEAQDCFRLPEKRAKRFRRNRNCRIASVERTKVKWVVQVFNR